MTKIDQQAKAQTSSLQVIEDLGSMFWGGFFDRLQFQDYSLEANKIGPVSLA